MYRYFCLAMVAVLFVPSFGTAQDKNPIVVIKTNHGNIKIELNARRAPATVKNFLEYVDDDYYDGTIFHRVIPDFMIQGGGFNTNKKEKGTAPPIKNESDCRLTNKRGTIAMARTSDPHSAASQFFINVKDNPFLDKANAKDGWGYVVFGTVIDGMDVVDKIGKVKTEQAKFQTRVKVAGKSKFQEIDFNDVPAEPVIIESIRLLK